MTRSRSHPVHALLCASAGLAAVWVCPAAAPAAAPRPNILFLLVDDLGYGDLGVLYQNSRDFAVHRTLPAFVTPNLDTLASNGVRLTRHYCPAPVCAPSRASLLLGVHQGHANVRDNQFDKALEDNHTLGTVLRAAGYATAVIGKWGLQGSGVPTAQAGHPLRRGFDYFFGLTSHLSGHFHYGDLMSGKTDDQGQPCAIYDGYTDVTASAAGCYSTDLFTARAKKWIADRHVADPSQPFFLYLALNAPHAQLNVPTQAYPAGGGLTGGVQWVGTPGTLINTASATIDTWIHPDYAAATYDDDANGATPEVAWPAAARRHATMVRRVDDAVADLRQLLADLGIAENTLIVFTSDNGPHNEAGSGGSYTQDPRFFRSYAGMDGIKRDTWEAGMREPTFACWPAGIPAGRTSDALSQFHDWMPTFAELAGVPAPARSDGVSLVPALTGQGTRRTGLVYVEYYNASSTPSYADFDAAHRGAARYQQQVVYVDGYKGVRRNIAGHTNDFLVYDPAVDPQEATNLAGRAGIPAQQRFKDRVLQVRRVNSTAARPYDAEPVPPIVPTGTVAGLEWRAYERAADWVPDWEADTAAASGTTTGLDLSVRTRDADIGLLFSGYLHVPADDTYTFYLTTDSGAFVRLHDLQLLDADFAYTGGVERTSGPIPLKTGRHPIRVFYRHANAAGHALSLQWESSTIARQEVPASAFFRDGVAPPSPPTAYPDSASTTGSTHGAGASVLVDVLANDVDDGTPSALAIGGVAAPAGGTAVVESGRIRYTPATGFFGDDTFDYTVTDGTDSATATVSVAVYAVGDFLWFPLDETTGAVARDAGGRPLGTLLNFASPPGWTTGRWAGALSFDGTDDCVTVGADYVPPLGASPRTVSAWIRPDATQPEFAAWLSYGVNTSGQRFSLRTDAGRLRLEVQSGYVVGTAPLADGAWHHVAIVVSDANGDGTNNVTDTKLYVDGLPDTFSSSLTREINSVAGPVLTLGGSSHAAGYNFKGALDDVRILPRALSAAEVAALCADVRPIAKAWYFRHYGESAPTDVEWQADADGNGLRALQEYAWGGAPFLAPAPGFDPELVRTGGAFEYSYTRRAHGTAEIGYQAEYTLDLRAWSDLPGTPSFEAHPTLPGFERARQAVAAPQPAGFLRLRAFWP